MFPVCFSYQYPFNHFRCNDMILGIIFCKEVHILLLVLSAICFSLWSIFCWVTGWRIGWAIAPAVFASAIRNIHVKITDSAPAPFQEAALTALESPSEYFESLRAVSIISFYIELSWMDLNVRMVKFEKANWPLFLLCLRITRWREITSWRCWSGLVSK